jgi:hypothetical protein
VLLLKTTALKVIKLYWPMGSHYSPQSGIHQFWIYNRDQPQTPTTHQIRSSSGHHGLITSFADRIWNSFWCSPDGSNIFEPKIDQATHHKFISSSCSLFRHLRPYNILKNVLETCSTMRTHFATILQRLILTKTTTETAAQHEIPHRDAVSPNIPPNPSNFSRYLSAQNRKDYNFKYQEGSPRRPEFAGS